MGVGIAMAGSFQSHVRALVTTNGQLDDLPAK